MPAQDLVEEEEVNGCTTTGLWRGAGLPQGERFSLCMAGTMEFSQVAD